MPAHHASPTSVALATRLMMGGIQVICPHLPFVGHLADKCTLVGVHCGLL